ncbi:MAG TPA: class IV adenylate cyclase [Pyrinomonadaceae bacterium]|jgi:adenylate cyclase class 2
MANEIEKKYRLDAARKAAVLESLNEIGAEFQGEDFEENILFSNAELAEKQAILRLRRIGAKTLVTFKQKLTSAAGVKHHLEYETEVADFDVIAEIVEHLGLQRQLVYEKRRRTWTFRNVEIVLDVLPFGEFMEIEGALTAIAEAEMRLGAEDFEVEPLTYPNLTLRLGKLRGGVTEARFD